MKLPCGCERGKILCPEAEALWAEVNHRWRAYCATPCQEVWENYLEALKEYNKHFQEEE